MIVINKRSGEPPELSRYRKTMGATYDDLKGDPKQKVRESLVKEQGGICAYCMKRIQATSEDMKIEHYLPKAKKEFRDKELCYQNMLAVCYGNEKIPDTDKTCDTSKQYEMLTINPISGYGISKIKYKPISGEIYSEDSEIQHDLNYTLNLNFIWLKQSRKAALDALKKMLNDKYKGDWKLIAHKWHNKYQTANPKQEYVGILLWYLQKFANR
ncbi:MAG: TIGR02646 family protein [Oscillospiraceae bacterium]|nr:TIGR02646 family protein [Oscillospiraceae bacterium]